MTAKNNSLISSLLLLAEGLPRADKLRFALLLCITVAMALMELFITGLVSLMATVFSAPAQAMELRPMALARELFPALFNADPRLTVLALLTGVLLAIVAKNLLMVQQQWHATGLSEGVSNTARARVFKLYLRAPYLWVLHTGATEMLFVLNAAARLGPILTGIVQMFSNLLMVLTIVCALMVASPTISLFFFCVMGLGSMLILRAVRAAVDARSKKVFAVEGSLHAMQQMGVNGLKEMRLYNREEALFGRYRAALDGTLAAKKRQQFFSRVPIALLEVLGFTALCVILCALIFVQDASMLTISAIMGFLAAAAWRCLPVANRLVEGITFLRTMRPYLDRVTDELTLEQRLKEELLPLGEAEAGAGEETLSFTRGLDFSRVSFTYPNTAEPALKDVSFSIQPGDLCGIVGLSGSGKSTLVNAITGLLFPSSGEFSVDGQQITLNNCRRWLGKIGYVTQSPYLLDASVAENIALSRWGEDVDRERVLACCEMASLDFIPQLENGIDAIVGERGVRLSGGQAQRIAIARALYSEPELVIFDEATSALDMKNEKAIRETILSLKNKVTMLVIAHRVSSVEDCDSIIWMENGVIKRAGPTLAVLPEYLKTLAQGEQPHNTLSERV